AVMKSVIEKRVKSARLRAGLGRALPSPDYINAVCKTLNPEGISSAIGFHRIAISSVHRTDFIILY
ncbi:MAG: hypothetical protein IJ927_04030, partial [Eubacterium sp.]|nr:hypothetical protein [Eubacterium sp.]